MRQIDEESTLFSSRARSAASKSTSLESKHDQRSGPHETRDGLARRCLRLAVSCPSRKRGRSRYFHLQSCGTVKFFLKFFYSRIDNTRLNFTLGIPGILQVEKFGARFKKSICL
jgi:hypothetical protein